MNGSSATLTSDLGIVSVSGRNRVASPPASKASGGISSLLAGWFIVYGSCDRSGKTAAANPLQCPPCALQRAHRTFADPRMIGNRDDFDLVALANRPQ